MATLQHNITTVLTQNLLAAGDNISNAKYISIANDNDIVLLYMIPNLQFYLIKFFI